MLTPVVIVNGLGAPRLAAAVYARALGAYGLRTFTIPQRLLGCGDIRESARLLADSIARIRAETGAARVHIVGMSLGAVTALYYVKCGGGAALVERFVSVGGPLNGNPLARVAGLGASSASHALAQLAPDSAFMRSLREAPMPADVRMFSIGTRGDVLTPRSVWDAAGLEPIETLHGAFPIGHWMLFTHPGNLSIVARCLTAS